MVYPHCLQKPPLPTPTYPTTTTTTNITPQGAVHGNCLTVDASGAQWCYVDHLPSSCQDLTPSARFPSNPWSYEACATPTLTQCSLLAPVAAPHHPIHPTYPEVPYNPHPIDCRVPIAGCPGFSPGMIITPGVAVGPTSVFPGNVRLATDEDSNAVSFHEHN